ncbi:uncharacterized protein I303_106158 [Kwoniella dejecticola CBS 10117]|uniref:Uncharacterized protein n=1 Tax=Kwoniella dejecticola CBS 10117 TaxID=1296121 RepID=A0A1A6A1F3_9TREE|nr:uncharacterized protein I303_06176 [Kwoniella dejecticola CBS 10117]OBR83891.1 hypothetical protein I303_06176 [Kwoniella dejecticola CBS 10117]
MSDTDDGSGTALVLTVAKLDANGNQTGEYMDYSNGILTPESAVNLISRDSQGRRSFTIINRPDSTLEVKIYQSQYGLDPWCSGVWDVDNDPESQEIQTIMTESGRRLGFRTIPIKDIPTQALRNPTESSMIALTNSHRSDCGTVSLGAQDRYYVPQELRQPLTYIERLGHSDYCVVRTMIGDFETYQINDASRGPELVFGGRSAFSLSKISERQLAATGQAPDSQEEETSVISGDFTLKHFFMKDGSSIEHRPIPHFRPNDSYEEALDTQYDGVFRFRATRRGATRLCELESALVFPDAAFSHESFTCVADGGPVESDVMSVCLNTLQD